MCVRAAYHQPTSPRKHFDSFFTQLIDPICLNSLLNLSSANVCLGSFSLKFYSTDGFTQFCSQPLSQFFTQLIISQQLVSRLVFTQVLLNLMDSRLCFLQKLRVKMNENVSRWSSLIFFYLRVDSLIFLNHVRIHVCMDLHDVDSRLCLWLNWVTFSPCVTHKNKDIYDT